MDRKDRSVSRPPGFDRQGRRLGVLGVGVLVVLGIVGVFALKDLGEVLVRLAESGAPVWALGGLSFAILLGIAKVVEAFSKPIETVRHIVALRRTSEDGAQHLPEEGVGRAQAA